MKNCLDEDKLISRKRNRPLQLNETEQLNSSEKKKEIFLIKYDSIESNEKTYKRKNNGAASKLFALEKHENVITITKEKGKENIRRRKKAENSTKEKKFFTENEFLDKPKEKTPNDKILDYDKFLEEINSDKPNADSKNVNKNLVSLLKKGNSSNPAEKAPISKKVKTLVKGLKSNLKINNKTFTKFLDKNKTKKRKMCGSHKLKNKNCSDIYNINNFIVQTNNSNKIVQKTNNIFEIKVPNFSELEEIKEEMESFSSDLEDTSDEVYLKYHNQYEMREKEYKSRLFCSADKNDRKKGKKINKNKVETAGTDTSDTNFKIRINLDVSCPNFDFKEEEITFYMEELNQNIGKIDVIGNNIEAKEKPVSDREILKVIKEEKNFPLKFSKPVKLSLLIKYYHKYWNNEFTDDSSSEEESDGVPYRSIFDK